MKKIILPLVAVMFSLTACNWNDIKNLDYTQNHPSFEESDPEGYALYLENIRDYKASEHPVMIVGFETISEEPHVQSQHITSLPDSVDYVWLKNIKELHPRILDEIKVCREQKAMQFLADVNFDTMKQTWSAMQDAKEAEGKPLGSEEEFVKFVEESTKTELAKCVDYELDGIVFTANGSADKAQDKFIETVKNWHATNGSRTFIFRGGVKNISDVTALKFCKYLVVIGTENTSTAKDLSSQVTRILGYNKEVPTDRVVVEVTVPNSEHPEQVGASPAVAAQWYLDNLKSRYYTPRGIVIANVNDDYYRNELDYENVRKAITLMNEGLDKE